MGVRVDRDDDRGRYEIRVDGQLAGHIEFHREDGLLAVDHTEIDDSFAGQGLGSKLVRGVLDDARERGLSVLPFCPFVRSWIERHPGYLDLVPADQRARFELQG